MKLKCEEMLAALSDYVDGELDPEIREAFQQHLADCNPCEVVVDNIRQTITVYKSGKPVELPAKLRRQLGDVLRKRWKERFPDAQ